MTRVRLGCRPLCGFKWFRRAVLTFFVACEAAVPTARSWAQPWTAEGPEVVRNGQVEGQPGPPVNPVVGGVKAIAPVPFAPDQMIIGAVNGGIWRTTNLNGPSPTWTWVTPNGVFPPAPAPPTPLSIGAISFTRNDPLRAYAGLGLFSSFLRWGTALDGPPPYPPSFNGTMSPIALLRSTDQGATWSVVDFTAGSGLAGVNISGVQSRGANVVVVTGRTDGLGPTITQKGLFRSVDANNPTATFVNRANGINGFCTAMGVPYVCCTGLATGTCSGLPPGDYTDLVNGPGNISVMYTAVINAGTDSGVYCSLDAGFTWASVYTVNSVPAAPAAISNIKLAGRDDIGDPATVWAAILTTVNDDTGGQGPGVTQVVRFGETGDCMPTVKVLNANPVDAGFGVNPGGQGDIHVSIVGAPNDPNIVYIGGDRQQFPFTIGANDFSGRLFRGVCGFCSGDATVTCDPTAAPDPCVAPAKGTCMCSDGVCSGDAAVACSLTAVPDPCVAAGKGACTTTWKPITHNGTAGNSAPHADSRAMAFVGSTLFEGDDAGVYRQSSPSDATGNWTSRIGSGLQITEVYGIAFDRIAQILVSSNQDTGAIQQSATFSATYDQIPRPGGGFMSGDGGVVGVDNLSRSGMGQSVRYSSSNGLSNMQSAIYNAANAQVGAATVLTQNEGAGPRKLSCEQFYRTPAPFALNAVDATGMRMVIGTGTPPAAGMGVCAGPVPASAVWESTNAGASFTQVAGLGANQQVSAVLAGGRRCGANDLQVLFAGTDGPALYRRPAAGGNLAVLPGYTGNTPWDLVVDPDNWAHLFVVDVFNKRIWRSLNADAAAPNAVFFANITNNLLTVAGAGFEPMTIEYVNGMIAVGGLGGVYVADASAVKPVWSLLGTGLPNAIVTDLVFDPDSNTLFAGELGRGIWSIPAPNAPPPPRHFECYEIHRPPLNLAGVTLVDQFGTSTVTIKKAKRLCAPANKNCENPGAVTDPAHLTAYTIKQTTPRFQRIRNVQVTNQFGSIVIDLIRPERLLLPTAKSLVGMPLPLVNPPDHYKCYKVRGAKFRQSGVKVETQFGELTVDIKKPLHLCAPVDKNGEGVGDFDTHLMCYKIQGPRPVVPDTVFTSTQLGDDQYPLFGVRELCVPSAKTLLP